MTNISVKEAVDEIKGIAETYQVETMDLREYVKRESKH